MKPLYPLIKRATSVRSYKIMNSVGITYSDKQTSVGSSCNKCLHFKQIKDIFLSKFC